MAKPKSSPSGTVPTPKPKAKDRKDKYPKAVGSQKVGNTVQKKPKPAYGQSNPLFAKAKKSVISTNASSWWNDDRDEPLNAQAKRRTLAENNEREAEDIDRLNQRLQQSLLKNKVDRSRPKPTFDDGEEDDQEDSDDGFLKKAFPVPNDIIADIKMSKESIRNRNMKQIWDHSGPRKDQLHTYMHYRYRIIPNFPPWFLTYCVEFTKYWDWAIFAMTVVTFYILSYVAIFSFYDPTIFRLVYILDLIFLADTSYRVTLEIWRYKNQVPFMILISPYGFYSWLTDALSVFPVERFAMIFWGTEDLNVLSTYDTFRFNRVLRFFRLFIFLDATERERRISERVHFFIKYTLVYVVFIQTVACIFFKLMNLSPIDIMFRKQPETKDTWLENIDSKKPGFGSDNFDYYVLSIYFSTSMVTTTGYGDMDAINVTEMLISIAVMLIGAIVLRGLFSSRLTNLELKLDLARFDLFHRAHAIQDYLAELRAAALFCDKVQEYYPLLWNFRRGVQEVPFFSILPRSMQEDIKLDFSEAMFHKSPIFRGLDEAFCRAVASRVQVILYNPGMILCNSGQFGVVMYYVLQGELRTTATRRVALNTPFNEIILRPGTLFGEMNLFFSYPHEKTIETRTCCQIIQIDKDQILEILLRFPDVLQIFRERILIKLKELHKYHQSVGRPPAVWIYASEDLGFYRENGKEIPKNNFPVIFRRSTGLNKILYKDFIDDSKYSLIVDMPCIDHDFLRHYTVAFENCLIPNILLEKPRVQMWTFFMMLFSMYCAFLDPYCLAFRIDEGFIRLACEISWDKRITMFIIFVYLADVWLEITQCVPCSGLYYQLVDGFRVQKKNIHLWTDLFSIVSIFLSNIVATETYSIQLIAVFAISFRLWRVVRYLTYLDNVHPEYIFFFRLMKTVLMLIYGVHFLTCINYGFACPAAARRHPPICRDSTWLNSYELRTSGFDFSVHHTILSDSHAYLISFFYACATISTAGFGDFNPQNQTEMFVIIFFELVSFYILCYSSAILTSALSCVVRPRLLAENKLGGVKTFMKHYYIPEALRDRILEHYSLQGRLWRGVTLPLHTFHYMFDCPNYLQDDALVMEFNDHFDGVTLLSKLELQTLIKIAKSVRRYLVPPNIVFLRKGEVRRKMYIIAKGSVGFFSEYSDDLDKPLLMLEPTCYFGVRDLIIAEPSQYFVKTLSHSIILEVEYNELLYLMSIDPHLEHLLFATQNALKGHIDNMATEFASHRVLLTERVPDKLTWIIMPTKERDIEGLTYLEYIEPFQQMKFGRIIRMLLLERVINPNGHFALFWTVLMSLISILVIGTLLLESFMQLRTVRFRVLQYALDFVNVIDIFIRFHWGFYTEEGLLLVHPVQTALHYMLEGTFVYDVAFCIPYELCLPIVGATNFWGTTGAIHWYSKFRWVRIGQLIRFPPILLISHGIFKARTTVLIMMYGSLTIAICTALAAFATYLACPIGLFRWEAGDETKFNFCDVSSSWTGKKDLIALLPDLGNRWIVGVYYVAQVILLIGYGDMITLNTSELLLLIVMMLFGCVIMVCALSDITAAEVDLENVKLDYIENMKRMEIMMDRERVHPALQKNIMQHLIHTWEKSKGLQPKTLLADLHPALRADVYEHFVGLMLRRIPLFHGLDDNIIRKLGQSLHKIYFVKGERMARVESLETQMYIIVDGKVWITDLRRRWCYTLKGGESFGEVCMVYGTRRTFNAFAGSTVEVFAITREDYVHILLRYPTIGEDFKRKLKSNSYFDLYTRTRKKVRQEPYEVEEIVLKTAKVNQAIRSMNRYDATFVQPGGDSCFRKRIFDYGTLQNNLPFLYFTSLTNDKFQLLIHPLCGFTRSFMDLVGIACCLTACLGVLEACFGDEDSVEFLKLPIIKHTRIIFEVLIYIRMIVGFLTPFELRDETYCKSHKVIALNYLTTVTEFPLDAISTLPNYFFVNATSWTKWLPLIKVIRLIPFYRHEFKKGDDILRSTLRQKVTISVVSFLIVAHILACIFYVISACECSGEIKNSLATCSNVGNMCPRGSWTYAFIRDHKIDETNRYEVIQTWRWYLRSVYWVITTISTTGFGTITPHTIEEILLGVICIFSGAVLLSVILSHFTSGISSYTQSSREYFFQVGILNSYYKTIGISREKERRVMTYFVYYWEQMRGVPYHVTTSDLPISLKVDLCYALYGIVLEDCPLFEPCVNDVTFIRQVCVTVQHGYYAPGTNIATQGDNALFLYIVYRGNILSWGVEQERFKIMGAFNVSEPFGKHGVLVYDQFYTKNYRAETHVEVLTLTQTQILDLCKEFPVFAESLEDWTAHNIDLKDGQETIFNYQRGLDFANRRNKFSQQYIESQHDGELMGGVLDRMSRIRESLSSGPSFTSVFTNRSFEE